MAVKTACMVKKKLPGGSFFYTKNKEHFRFEYTRWFCCFLFLYKFLCRGICSYLNMNNVSTL